MSGRLQLSSDSIGNGAPESLSAEPTLDEFREAVLAAAIQARVNQGRTYFPPVPPEELRRVEGDHLLRTEVAADFVQLMTSAREQLRVDQAGPPGSNSDSARQVTAIGLGSAYRDVTTARARRRLASATTATVERWTSSRPRRG